MSAVDKTIHIFNDLNQKINDIKSSIQEASAQVVQVTSELAEIKRKSETFSININRVESDYTEFIGELSNNIIGQVTDEIFEMQSELENLSESLSEKVTNWLDELLNPLWEVLIEKMSEIGNKVSLFAKESVDDWTENFRNFIAEISQKLTTEISQQFSKLVLAINNENEQNQQSREEGESSKAILEDSFDQIQEVVDKVMEIGESLGA